MFGGIVKKEFPLGDAPEVWHFMIVKANQERSDEIKFSSEIWQRPESFDSLNDATDAEQMRGFSKHWQFVHI